MKKFSGMFSMALLAAMLLGACSNNGTVEPTTIGTGSLETPMVTETGLGTDVFEPTMGMDLTLTPAETNMAETPMTETTTTADMSAGSYRLSELLDYGVVSETGDVLGSVNALVVAPDSGNILYVLVEPDLALGSTNTVVAVPWGAFYHGDMQNAAGAVQVEGLNANNFTLNVDQAALTGAPGYASADEIDFGSDAWDTDWNTYWQGLGVDLSGMNAASGQMAETPMVETPVVEGTQSMSGAFQQPILLDSAADLSVDSNVYSTNDEQLGQIEDIIVDPSAGKVVYVVVSTGGFLGIGENYTPIPWSAVSYDGAAMRFSVTLPADQLSGAPAYSTMDELFNSYQGEGFTQEVNTYWGVSSGT